MSNSHFMPNKGCKQPSLTRRQFLTTASSLLLPLAISEAGVQGKPTGQKRNPQLKKIETRACFLSLDSFSGALIGIHWKNPNVEVIQEPRLGENFRILLPRPDYEANYFSSRDQQVSRIEETPLGVVCVYDSLRNDREIIAVKVRYQIRQVNDQLEFLIEIDNPTEWPLAEVFFGIIGGQRGLIARQDTASLVPGLNTNLAPALFTHFRAGGYGGGNLGIRYDATGFTYPGAMQMGWIEFFNRKADLGLYYANHDLEPRLTGLYFELRPFTKSAEVADNWPEPADLPAEEPIGLTMGWLKFPYIRKGTFQSGPIVLQVHQGDWHEGSKLYRKWFDLHFQVRRPATWLRREMAWQSIILSNCEDVIVHRFNDLPKLAADAKKYGVTTFEILGWDIGGIDRGYPQYHPDPRLGTPEEFRQALAELKSMGVHSLIFANIQEADTGIPQFKNDLNQFAVMGRWAEDLRLFGWGEGTISARMGLTNSQMTLVSPAHTAFRKLLIDQFVHLIRDGGEGFQLDKTVLNGYLDFNPRLHTSPDLSLTEGMLETFREVLSKCREVNPNFALASEIFWDRAFPYVDVSYMRMNEIDMPSPALRYTFPEWMATICAEGPGDFNVINNGMRYGLVWAMQPRHYNDSMDEFLTRPLSEYVRELIRIRAKHKSLLFHGRFQDTVGAEVKAGPHIRYSVFEGIEKPGKGCVIVNYGNEEAIAGVTWPGGEGTRVELLQPWQPDKFEKLPIELRLPPRSCAVIVEVKGPRID